MTIAAAAGGAVVEKVTGSKPPASVALLLVALGVFLIWLGLSGGGIWKATTTPGTAFEGPASGGAGGGGSSGAD